MTLKGSPSRGGAVRVIVPFRFFADKDAVCMFYCYPASGFIIMTDSHRMVATEPYRSKNMSAHKLFTLFKSRISKQHQRKHIDTIFGISKMIWEMPGTPVAI
jgi:hypothetical protein